MRDLLTDLFGYFLRGLLFLAPVGITVSIIVWVFNFLNDIFSPLTDDMLPFRIPGLGLVLVFAILAMLGFIVSHLISLSAENWLDRLMGRTPLVKVIYFSVKDIIALFSDKQDKLGRPVRVRVLRAPLQYRFGFLTREDMTGFGFGEEMRSVYLPLSYGIVGNQMVVHRDDVEFVDLPATEVMKFIVSGGVTQIGIVTKGQEPEEHE